LHLVGYILEYYYDAARTHERKMPKPSYWSMAHHSQIYFHDNLNCFPVSLTLFVANIWHPYVFSDSTTRTTQQE